MMSNLSRLQSKAFKTVVNSVTSARYPNRIGFGVAKTYTMKTVYALYDSRYTADPDRAVCYTVADSLREAKKDKREMFDDAVIVKQVLKQTGPQSFEVVTSEIVG